MRKTIDLPPPNALLEALPVAIFSTDTQGRLSFYNRACVAFWGYEPPLGKFWCGSWTLYHLDGSPMAIEDSPMAQTLRTGVAVRGVEAIAERPDETCAPLRPRTWRRPGC